MHVKLFLCVHVKECVHQPDHISTRPTGRNVITADEARVAALGFMSEAQRGMKALQSSNVKATAPPDRLSLPIDGN